MYLSKLVGAKMVCFFFLVVVSGVFGRASEMQHQRMSSSLVNTTPRVIYLSLLLFFSFPL